MKYQISEKQYSLILESLGVPDSVTEEAENLYDIFLKHFESIDEKSNKYNFNGEIDIVLGDKKKIVLDEYSLEIEIIEQEGYEGPPQIASMGMSHQFTFDPTILMKKTNESRIAEFTISFVVGEEWEPHQLYEEFVKNKDKKISGISHELKHKYDKQVKRIDLIGPDAEYDAIRTSPRFGIDVIDNKFRYYLYYTHLAEDLVRSTEVASLIKRKNISQSEFIKFLKNNETFKTLVEIKNFSFEEFVEEITKEMPKVDKVIESIGEDPKKMTDSEKIEKILQLIYINLSNTKIKSLNEFIGGPAGGLFTMFRMFGGQVPKEVENIEKVREKFFNHVSKFVGRPTDFIKFEVNRFRDVADKTIRKLSKLYAITHKNQTNESIINWDLHMKLMDKKYGKRKIDSKIINY